MNQKKTKTLRDVFVAPFPEGDKRNKAYFRLFKREYNRIPRPLRAKFVENLRKLKEVSNNNEVTA